MVTAGISGMGMVYMKAGVDTCHVGSDEWFSRHKWDGDGVNVDWGVYMSRGK